MGNFNKWFTTLKWYWKVVFILIPLYIIGSLLPKHIEGKYIQRIKPEQEYVMGDVLRKQNTYFELLKDKTIHFHSESGSLGYGTIDWYGTYNYSEKKNNQIAIIWNEGGIQPFIHLEDDGVGYKFYIGESIYSNK